MSRLQQDFRYGMRQLWRSPGFTVAALATLALGIGANTALFTLGDAIMGRPLPGVVQSDRLAWVSAVRRDGRPVQMGFADYQDYRDGLHDLIELAAVSDNQFSLAGSAGEPERADGQIVSGNFFSVLRTPFVRGRGFLPAEDSIGSPKGAVVISYDLWQRRFNGDAGVIGQILTVNGQPLSIVGVTTRGFNGADIDQSRHVWMTYADHYPAAEFARRVSDRGSRTLVAIGRLRPDVTLESLQAPTRTIAARIATTDSARYEGMSGQVYSAKAGLPPGAEREVRPVAILSAVVTGVVLLIACANLSNLLLARGVSRRREVAVRLSLGASRARLVQQLLTESVLLATAAGALGLLLAFWTCDALLSSGILPLPLTVTPDARVISFTLVATAVSTVLFGLLPAIESTRHDLARTIKDGGEARNPRRRRLQSGFVVTQLALSLTLLTTAGLFLRSMAKANSVDIGFEAGANVLAMSFDLGLQRYSDERALTFIHDLDDKARTLPGVQDVTFTDIAPLGNRYIFTNITVRDPSGSAPPSTAEAETQSIYRTTVRPGFFRALGIRIVRGRDFAKTDTKSSDPVVIISERTARELWPHVDPIGRRISLTGERGTFMTIVGVAADIRLGGPSERGDATAYVPQLQYPESKRLTMLVRSVRDASGLAGALRRVVRSLDSSLPLFNVQTMAAYKKTKLADRRNGATILGGFGGLALLLASIGVYGVMAFSVIQRTKEIGIRVALGARKRDVISLFVGRGLRLIGIGVAIGVALSLAMSKLLRGMLFGLTPTDAATFVGVAALLAMVALLASWLPARRGARVDPMQALRYE